MMKKLLIAGCIVLLLLLSSCSLFAPEVYTVSFYVDGQLYTEQQVEEGSCPVPFDVSVAEGLRFVQWTCQQESIDPFSTVITEENGIFSFEAELIPTLNAHMPYLFPDDSGLLRPDDSIWMGDVEQAMAALVTENAKPYLPQLPVMSAALSGDALCQVFAPFFDAQALAEAFPQAEPVTRAEFAQGMNALLGRQDGTFILGANAAIPADVTADREDAAALLEACLRHTPDETGITWADIELPVTEEPGFLLKDGILSYVQEDHYLLRDGTVGLLYFDENGQYTSGDAELDQMVTDILKQLSEQAPDADRLTLLRSAYDHCHTQYKYLRKEAYSFGQTGWEIEDAKEMFSSGRGNCYNFAAIFWALARGLGYDARAVSGTCTGTDQPHGWVIIEIDGADHFFDPEWQYAYTEREVFDKDMFMIPMDKVGYWIYKWQE